MRSVTVYTMTPLPKLRWFRNAALMVTPIISLLAAPTPAGAFYDTFERDYGWLVELHLNDEDESFCSGVLIAPRRVITAAHCVDGMAQDTGLNVTTTTGNKTAAVAKIISHRQHAILRDDGPRHTHVTNDIAMLHLAEPIALPVYLALPYGKVRGDTYLYGASSYRKEVELRVSRVTKQATLWFNHVDERKHIVAAAENGTASCSGDSGGGLVTWVNGKPVLTGIVSYGAVRCGQQVPTVFTKVTAYTNWLGDARR